MRLITKGLILLTILCFVSCGGNEQTNTTETVDTKTEEKSTETLPTLKDPCEILSGSDMMSLGGYTEASDGKPNLGSSETWRICDFIVDKRGISVSLKRYKDRIIETKGVERAYQKTLEMKDEFSRVEVPNAPGDQAIYIYGKKGLTNSYSLQWRYANHTEGMIAISYGEAQNADDVLKSLVAIANKMDE